MEDFSHKKTNNDQPAKMAAENKKLKEELSKANTRIQALERNISRRNRSFREIQTLEGTVDVQEGKTVINTSNASLTRSGFQSSSELVVTDSSKRAQGPILVPGIDHHHDSPKFPEKPAVNSGSNCPPLIFTTSSWSEQKKKELRNSQDEQRLRHFLCIAITTHASSLASEGFGLQASDFPDHLVSRGCITEEECSKLLNSSNTPVNLMRVILGLVIRRDCNTLLSFIDILFQYNEFLAKDITQTFDNITIDKDDLFDLPDCSHCLLREKVEPVLIIDRLIGHNYRKWLPFYEQVTRLDSVPEKRVFLWDMFMAQVNNGGAFAEMLLLTIEALEVCGFHSDIVKSLRDDQRVGSNSFICRHSDLPEETLKYSNDLKNEVSEPKMHEIKLDELADNENTNLKQIFCPMIQNVPTDSSGDKMQELKSCKFESQVGTSPLNGLCGHNKDEQTNDGKQNDSKNSSCAIIFVTDSNITIAKREDN